MKAKKTKKTNAAAVPEIICGDLSNVQETSRELDQTMKVVWTSVGFWAYPKV